MSSPRPPMTPGERAVLLCAVTLAKAVILFCAAYVSTLRGERARQCKQWLREMRQDLKILETRLAAGQSQPEAAPRSKPEPTGEAQSAALGAAPETATATQVPAPAANDRHPIQVTLRAAPHPDRWRKNTRYAPRRTTPYSFRLRN